MMIANLSILLLMEWTLFGGLSLLLVLVGALILLAFCTVISVTRPTRRTKHMLAASALSDIPVEDITFASAHGKHQVHGQYMPCSGTATTVLVCSGYRRSMQTLPGIAHQLWQAGHNVLLFEYYGHGQITGTRVTLGHGEVQDFLGAVAYAKSRAPQTRLGALGYSMGAAVTIMGCAQTDEVEALVLDSAFATQWSAIEMRIRQTLHLPTRFPRILLWMLYGITDLLLKIRMGYRLHEVEPIRAIASLAPRPIFIIHGLNDTVVSPQDAYLLYEAAQSPKALWVLPGTKHIRAYYADRVTYTERVIQFFQQHIVTADAAQPSMCETHQQAEKECVV